MKEMGTGPYLVPLLYSVFVCCHATVIHLPSPTTHLVAKTIPAKLPDHVDSLAIRPASTSPLVISATTFADPSYTRLHSLDLTSCGLTSLVDSAFAKLTTLRHLVLANNTELTYDAMTSLTFSGIADSLVVLELHSTSPASTVYPAAALSPLVKLERLTITGVHDVAFPGEMSSLESLVSLRIVGRGCNVGTLTNATFEAFRNLSRLNELTIRACGLKAVEVDSLDAFKGRLKSLNLACNPGLGYSQVQGALSYSDLFIKLDTLIVDDINAETGMHSLHDTMFEMKKGVPAPRLRRLSFRANDVSVLNMQHANRLMVALRNFNIGYNKLNYTVSPPSQIARSLSNLTLKVIDAGSLFESRASYRLSHCSSDGPFSDNSYFRQADRLPDVDYNFTKYHDSASIMDTTVHGGVPRSVHTLFMDHYHRRHGHMYMLGSHRLHEHNQLRVWNVSYSMVRQLVGPFENFNLLQVFTLAHSQLNSIHEHALNGMPHLLYIYLQDNRLAEIPSAAFFHQQHLLHLDLSSNRLNTVDEDLFAQQVALKTLSLAGNRLKHVDFYFNAAHLNSVDLSSNPIETIGSSITHHSGTAFTRRSMFTFDHVTTFVCDCSSLAFSVWWADLHGDTDHLGPPSSSRHASLNCSNRGNIAVASFGHQGLAHCEHSPTTHRAAIGLFAAVVVMAAVAGIMWTVVHLRKVRANGSSAGESTTSAARYRQFRNDDDISFR